MGLYVHLDITAGIHGMQSLGVLEIIRQEPLVNRANPSDENHTYEAKVTGAAQERRREVRTGALGAGVPAGLMSWADGFSEYISNAYEVRLHKRKDTFGGVLWPENPQDKFLKIAVAALDKRKRVHEPKG